MGKPARHGTRTAEKEYVVEGYYGRQHGWERVTSEETLAEAKEQLAIYDREEPGYAHRVVARREEDDTPGRNASEHVRREGDDTPGGNRRRECTESQYRWSEDEDARRRCNRSVPHAAQREPSSRKKWTT